MLNPNAAEQAKRQRQQPGNNAPFWKDARSEQEYYTPARGVEAGVLIQSGGETWRQRRNNQIIPLAALLVTAALGVCALFFLWRGTIRLREPRTGRRMLRFSLFERSVHWTTAITFVILAVSGLTMLFGKTILLPIIGHTLFAWLTMLGKNLHNFTGPVFALSVILMLVTFVRDNFPGKGDLVWLLKGGGLLSGKHVPSGRFNSGEKIWFWGGVLVLGLTASATGLILDFPNFAQGRGTMQLASVIHVIAAALMTAMALAHIYIGTLGMEGAYEAMKTGYVDESWAREHHEYWYEDHKRDAIAPSAVPGARGAMPAGAPQAKETSA